MMVAPREIELKLELDPSRSTRTGGARRRLGSLPGLPDESGTRRLVSSIFDTADFALQRRGIVLRIRRDGERRIQTLKGEAGDGLFGRVEWECEVDGDEPDLTAIADPELRDEVSAAGALTPVLETEFDRTFWLLRHDGSDVELVLDEGTIRAGGRTAPINEIEIELKSGAPTALFGVARAIVGAMPARLGMQSKSERGYGLLKPEGDTKSEPFPTRKKMKVAVAFQVIVRSCLRQYRLNEPGIFGRDADALHKARVAIRRLRSCLKLHKVLVTDPEGERLKGELRRLSQLLGEARNLDVYLERISGDGVDALILRAKIAAERELAYDRLTLKLRAKRARLLLLDLMAYVETGAWLRDPARRKLRETKLRRFAAGILEKRWRRMRKSGRDLAGQSAEARHEVRIEGKVLRYASEFFAGAFPGRPSRRSRSELLDALADLQTHLGDLNDMETGATLVTDAPIEPVLVDHEREVALIAAAQKAHRRIRKVDPFWA